MNKSVPISAMAALATLGLSAQAQELTARVISSTPVVQQVQVPRTICNDQPVAIQQPRSGAGAVIGAIAGAALGNAIGGGSGRAAATAIGLVGGAAVGDRIEGSGTTVRNMQGCSTQTFLENRTVAYNVTYEYDSRQYTVQMANDPGPTLRLNVTPANASAPAGSYPAATGEALSAPPGTPIVRGVVASAGPHYPASSGYTTYPSDPSYSGFSGYSGYTGHAAYPSYPVYPAYPAYAPAYPYSSAYYAPIGISLGIGYVSGGWHRHHGHRGHHGGHRGHRGHRGHWR